MEVFAVHCGDEGDFEGSPSLNAIVSTVEIAREYIHRVIGENTTDLEEGQPVYARYSEGDYSTVYAFFTKEKVWDSVPSPVGSPRRNRPPG